MTIPSIFWKDFSCKVKILWFHVKPNKTALKPVDMRQHCFRTIDQKATHTICHKLLKVNVDKAELIYQLYH